MNRSPLAFVLTLCGIAAAGSPALVADAVFNFNSDTVGEATNFTNTVNGISATFSSPLQGGFFVATNFLRPPMSGNILLDSGVAPDNNIPLFINFSTEISSIILDFGLETTKPGALFDMIAFNNGTEVGSAFATGGGPSFRQGTIGLGLPMFNEVELFTNSAPAFAIDNVRVAGVTPEPASMALFGLGGLGLMGISKLRRRYFRS